MSENNICSVCGGLLIIEYTMVFEQGRPQSMRVEPTPLPTFKFCPGHEVEGSSTRDWEKLNVDQKYDVDLLRMRIRDYMIAQTETFYTQHPELRLTWSMTLDALIREDK